MDIIILTGMSGSGKSQVSNYLEDMGFFCVDNLPPHLVGELVRSLTHGKGGSGFGVERMAFVIDVRSAGFFDGMSKALADLDAMELDYRLIFLDSTNEALLSRYKQTRRVHPLANRRGNAYGIQEERERLSPLRRAATDIIDTTNFSLHDLRDYIYKLLNPGDQDERMSIFIESFGFKYGIPVDSDLVLDVRFIPNPYYNPKLRVLTGLDEEVIADVFSHSITRDFVEKQSDLLQQILPYYVREGKVRLTISVGCTGGRHRSVALAEEFAMRLRQAGYGVTVYHRDRENDPHNITKMKDYWRAPEEQSAGGKEHEA